MCASASHKNILGKCLRKAGMQSQRLPYVRNAGAWFSALTALSGQGKCRNFIARSTLEVKAGLDFALRPR